MNPDVIVAGAGIVGAAVSFRLSASGRRVLIIDTAAPVGSATRASGAMLGVLGELTAHDPPADLALRINAWSKQPTWREEAGLPAAAAGTFVVAGRDRSDDLAALAAMEAAAEKYRLRAERVDPGDIAELAAAPGYDPAGALFLADEAWVDGPVLRQLIIAAAVRPGTSVVLDQLALGNGQQIEARRRDAAEFLRGHGRPEMVPEAVIDLLSARSA